MRVMHSDFAELYGRDGYSNETFILELSVLYLAVITLASTNRYLCWNIAVLQSFLAQFNSHRFYY